MDFTSLARGNSLTGGVSKAVLCIRKVDNVAPPNKQKSGEEGIDDLTPAEKDAIDQVNEVNKKLLKRAENTLKTGEATDYSDVVSDSGDKYLALELQYNPASIRLDTSAGQQMKYEGGAGDVQVKQHVAPASTTLSCELLFDDVNNMDAFMLSDNPLTGATASNIANTATSAIKSKYSVQRQMEGLLALLTVPEARHVIFFWGAMSFRGEMTEVSTRYTMFNKKGYPVRGTASIQIRQGDGNEGVTGVDQAFKYDENYWHDAFNRTFTTDGPGASTFSKAANNSMLNLKL